MIMKYLVCIDDTDMPGTKGTGWLVQELCEKLEKSRMGSCSPISRHQLFVHEDIPYTSHNSSMCFEINLENQAMEPIISSMANFLETRSEPGSDPGLCVAKLDSSLARKELIAFGKMAKQAVTSKAAAYDLARQSGIHLSEHGGTGDGVVGAVAGIGLRLSGNDGRYRGWYHLGQPGSIVRVDTLCGFPFIDQLVTRSGTALSTDMSVSIGSEKTKTVRMDSRQVVVVLKNEEIEKTGIEYRTITKQEAKQY
jgi:hypothetical protein